MENFLKRLSIWTSHFRIGLWLMSIKRPLHLLVRYWNVASIGFQKKSEATPSRSRLIESRVAYVGVTLRVDSS